MKKIIAIVLAFMCFITGCSNTQLKTLLPSNLFSSSNPKDFLTHDTYRSLTLEIISVEGCQPSTGDFDFVLDKLKPYLDKPDGVRYVCDPPISKDQARGSWSDSDIKDFEAKHSILNSAGSNLVVHMLYVPGTYDSTTLAFEYGPESIVFFYETFRYSGKTNITALHEMSHCCGWVNGGIPSRYDHEDPNHAAHCKNSGCLMGWNIAGQTESLCSDCVSDFTAYKESLK